MTGEELRPYISALDTTLASTARKLGLTPQNLDAALKVKDVKTGLIERLSEIYGKPVSWFFDEVAEARNPKGKEQPTNREKDLENIISLQKKHIQTLEKQLADKDKIIELITKINS